MKNLFSAVYDRPMTTMEKYLLAVIGLYVVVVAVKNPLFFSPETLFDMIRSGSGIMLLAMGVLVVLISGGIDVSFTAIAVVAAYCGVRFALATGIDSIWLIALVALVTGTLLGAVNAVLIHAFRLPTLIVTLGTASLYHGAMATFLGTTSYSLVQMPQSLVTFGSRTLLTVGGEGGQYGLSAFLLIVVAMGLVTWFLLYRTMLGRSVFAMGSNEESASRLGINILRTKLFVYSYSGLLAGLMGVMYFANLKYVNPVSLVGTELMIIAAVVIGGAKLTGGEGTLLGAILGVAIVQLFQSTLVFLGLGSSWNNVFFGSVLLISLGVMYYRQRVQNRRDLVFATA
jgi:simple sugar transport system permease protein